MFERGHYCDARMSLNYSAKIGLNLRKLQESYLIGGNYNLCDLWLDQYLFYQVVFRPN